MQTNHHSLLSSVMTSLQNNWNGKMQFLYLVYMKAKGSTQGRK